MKNKEDMQSIQEESIPHESREKESKEKVSHESPKNPEKETWTFKTDELKKWAIGAINKRINDALRLMNLPTRDQVEDLNIALKAIEKKIETLEKMNGPKKKSAENTSGEQDVSDQKIRKS